MIEKTINGKTYARVGNPTDRDAQYFKKNNDGTYDSKAYAFEPTTIQKDGMPETIYQHQKGGQSMPRPIQKTEGHSTNSLEFDEDMDSFSKNNFVQNPNADENRKEFFGDMGYKGDWAKEADKELRDPLKNVKGNALSYLQAGDNYDFDVEEPENDNMMWITKKDNATGKKWQYVYDKNTGKLVKYENGQFTPITYRDMANAGFYIPKEKDLNLGIEQD